MLGLSLRMKKNESTELHKHRRALRVARGSRRYDTEVKCNSPMSPLF